MTGRDGVWAGGPPRPPRPGERRSNEEAANFRMMREVRQGNKKQMLEIEERRRKFGAKEKNYFTLVKVGQGEENGEKENNRLDCKFFAQLLEDIGIKDTQVLAIGKSPFNRASLATEVILQEDVEVDIKELAKKLEGKNYPYEIISFGKETDTIRMKGLPLTAREEDLLEHIKKAVGPYVKSIESIRPGKWNLQGVHRDNLTDKYFNGKRDGIYYVQVMAKDGIAVPGFLPVGPNSTQVTVDYIRGGANWEMLCNVCFEPGHMRNDEACKQGKGWMQYVEKLLSKRRDGGEVVPETEEEKLKGELERRKEEIRKLQERVAGSEGLKEAVNVEKKQIEVAMNKKINELNQELNEVREDVTGRQRELNSRSEELKKAKEEMERMKEQYVKKGKGAGEELARTKIELLNRQEEVAEKMKIIAEKQKMERKMREEEEKYKEKMERFVSQLLHTATESGDVESFKELLKSEACQALVANTEVETIVKKYSARILSETDDGVDKIMEGDFDELEQSALESNDEEKGAIGGVFAPPPATDSSVPPAPKKPRQKRLRGRQDTRSNDTEEGKSPKSPLEKRSKTEECQRKESQGLAMEESDDNESQVLAAEDDDDKKSQVSTADEDDDGGNLLKSMSSSSDKEEELRKAKESVLSLFRNYVAKGGEGDVTEEDIGASKSGEKVIQEKGGQGDFTGNELGINDSSEEEHGEENSQDLNLVLSQTQDLTPPPGGQELVEQSDLERNNSVDLLARTDWTDAQDMPPLPDGQEMLTDEILNDVEPPDLERNISVDLLAPTDWSEAVERFLPVSRTSSFSSTTETGKKTVGERVKEFEKDKDADKKTE